MRGRGKPCALLELRYAVYIMREVGPGAPSPQNAPERPRSRRKKLREERARYPTT